MVNLQVHDPNVLGGLVIAALAGTGILLILLGVFRGEAFLRDWIGILVAAAGSLGFALALALGLGRPWTTGFLLLTLAGVVGGLISLVRRSRHRSLNGPRHG
jgi:hypothetical protein